MRVAELETLFTADVRQFEAKYDSVETKHKALDGKVANLQVDANASAAVKTLAKIESEARSLPDGEFEVTADTGAAKSALGDLEEAAKQSGEEGGEEAGSGLAGGIVAALATIPIAGAVIGVGVAAGTALAKAVEEGFAVEVRADRLMATTGLDPASVAKLGRAAGDAYGNNWGESLEANFATARTAVQAGLLDPESTKRDAQSVIESLSGVADIIEDDIAKTARATTTLMRNGLAATAEDAFDIIVKGQQAGLNVSEDWLDTINEYSVLWARLGLTAPQALGLMQQALQGGARDTDKAADALKEFQIRATDGSKLSAEGFAMLGLSATEMTAQIAKGGDSAAAGLATVLDKLRSIEDPVVRNAAAVALFGTQAEDMGDALYKMDLSNAVEQLGSVEGAAGKAMEALTDNTQNDIDTARRNIEVAADGIKGALAGAFEEPLESLAGWVTENRAGIMSFLFGLANGAIDVGIGFVEGIANATEAVGGFVSGPLADIIEGVAHLLNGMDMGGLIDGFDQASNGLFDMADKMRSAEETSAAMADGLRTNLIDNGLAPLQEKLNETGDQLIWEAEVHDAQVRLAKEIDGVGYSADGTLQKVNDYNGKIDTSTASGRMLDEQLNAVKDRMIEQATASAIAGESTDEMTQALDDSTAALHDQLIEMGFTEDQVKDLLKQYGLVPDDIVTKVQADTGTAYAALNRFIRDSDGRVITIKVNTVQGEAYRVPGERGMTTAYARGGIAIPMAAGGIPGTPLDPIAQMVPPGTNRIVGDRMDVDEAYIPLDGSRRSWRILEEALKRMPGGGGGAPAIGSSGDTYRFGNLVLSASEIPPEVIEFFRTIRGRARRMKG